MDLPRNRSITGEYTIFLTILTKIIFTLFSGIFLSFLFLFRNLDEKYVLIAKYTSFLFWIYPPKRKDGLIFFSALVFTRWFVVCSIFVCSHIHLAV